MDAGFPTKTQVIIVGCGPVGATLALMLGQRGVQTLIIDKALDIFLAPRAIAFDFDALRILQSLGLGEEDFNQVRIPFVRMISPIFGEFARINTAREIDTHPMQITFYQPDLERASRPAGIEPVRNNKIGLGTARVSAERCGCCCAIAKRGWDHRGGRGAVSCWRRWREFHRAVDDRAGFQRQELCRRLADHRCEKRSSAHRSCRIHLRP